ncbi:MAG: hypothetical protein ACK4R8_08055, partial [Thiobacillus sp.]
LPLHTVTKRARRETRRLLSSTTLQSVEANKATTGTETRMNTRYYGIFGIAALALAIAAPAHAAPDFPYGPIILVKKNRDEDRDYRRDSRPEDRRSLMRDDGHDDAYGTGYERRKQKRDDRGDDDDDRRRRRQIQ